MNASNLYIIAGVTVLGGVGFLWWRSRQSSAVGSDTGSNTDVTPDLSALSEFIVTQQKEAFTPTLTSYSGSSKRGIRNNNPGNLDYIANPLRAWNGQVGSDGRYGIYDTPANGVRAMSKQLQKDYNAGSQTITGLITSWAPPSENDTTAYIASVSRAAGVGPDEQFDLRGNLTAVVSAIIQHENGENPYSPDDINTWVHLS